MNDLFQLSSNEIQELQTLLSNSTPVESTELEGIHHVGCDDYCTGNATTNCPQSSCA